MGMGSVLTGETFSPNANGNHEEAFMGAGSDFASIVGIANMGY